MTSKVADRILDRFRISGAERLDRIEATWISLVEQGGRFDSQDARRLHLDLHTLKGDSRVVGFVDVNFLCHKLEDLVKVAEDQSFCVSQDLDLVVTMATQFISMLLKRSPGDSLGGIDLAGFTKEVDAVLNEIRATGDVVPLPARSPSHFRARAVSGEASQRISSAARLVFVESIAAGGRTRERMKLAWKQLRQQIEEEQWIPLERAIEHHLNGTAELAREHRKVVEVALDLPELAVHRDVAAAIDTAVLHAVRNAIGHGVETPEQRRALGKLPTGKISIRGRRFGNEIELVVEDDGAGVDFTSVSTKAIAAGLLRSTHVSERALIDVLFQPHFSVRDESDDLSGRGLGLAAVKAAIEQVGGRVELKTHPSKGTSIILRTPLGVPSVDAVCFQASRFNIIFASTQPLRPAPPTSVDPVLVLDPLAVIGIGTHPSDGVGNASKYFLVGTGKCYLTAGGLPFPVKLQRIMAKGSNDLFEVALVDGNEVLLLDIAALEAAR
jgi:two-component system, chemotaxis family, sensor kinase CheA